MQVIKASYPRYLWAGGCRIYPQYFLPVIRGTKGKDLNHIWTVFETELKLEPYLKPYLNFSFYLADII